MAVHIDVLCSQQRNFPWTKLNWLMKRPEIWKPQIEDGLTIENVDYAADEGNEFVTHFLVMHESDSLGAFTFRRRGQVLLEGHVSFRSNIEGAVKLACGRYVLSRVLRGPITKVMATVPRYNRPAMHYLGALNFTREGAIRNAYLHQGVKHDLVIFGLELE